MFRLAAGRHDTRLARRACVPAKALDALRASVAIIRGPQGALSGDTFAAAERWPAPRRR